jgi:ribosomal protein L11 methyltransferase
MMRDNYYELTVKTDARYVDLLADFIMNLYDDGIEFGAEHLILRSESDLTFVKDALLSLQEHTDIAIPMTFTLEEKENVDWIRNYQESVQPIEAGKFYIYPSWHAPKEGLINIKIDPALAFGSGHHATTNACLKAVSKYVDAGKEVIDVGCGSGILGLAAVKLGATVDLCDTDPLSVTSCKENFQLNEEIYRSLWEGSVNKAEQTYDVVIANIIADVLRFIASDLKKATKEGGTLILSGILDKKEETLKDAFSDLTLKERILQDEWVTLIYTKDSHG